MADTTTNARPRPRPRPRPVQKAGPQNTSSTTSGSTVNSIPGPSSRASDDIDDMFIKNKNRDLSTWKKLDEAKKDEFVTHIDDDSGSDSDENLSPNSRKRRREKSTSLPKPKWQRDKDFMRSISDAPKVLSDSEDSDLEILGEGSAAPRRSNQRISNKRAKRSRSRSITPPPQLPLQQIENVKRVVWKAMGSKPAAGSSAEEDDGYLSAEPLELDPELERIARQVQREASSVTPGFGAPTHSRGNSVCPDDDDEVQVRVKWKPHPNAPNASEDIVWEYKISRSDDFYELFEAIAEDAQIKPERLVVCFDGKRIFASVTPSTLNLWRSADFDAYERAAYDYIRSNPDLRYSSGLSSTQPQTQSSSGVNSGNTFELSDSDDDDAARASSSAQAAPSYPSSSSNVLPPSSSSSSKGPVAPSDSEAEDDDKFKLTLRSSATKDVTVTVRPTTKCGSIIKAFLKKAGLEAQYTHVFADNGSVDAQATPKAKGKGRGKGAKAAAPQKVPKLSLDGDKLDNDSPIGDADLEDGDVIDVVDL